MQTIYLGSLLIAFGNIEIALFRKAIKDINNLHDYEKTIGQECG